MKTKHGVWLYTLIVLSLLLAACSSNQAASSGSTGSTDPQSEASLSQVNMLLVGTLKLEGTERRVTTEQAATLLPLWQAYRSLSTSQTAAEAEVEALLQQIENSMSSEQVQAIEAMNLTNTDMMGLMQSISPVMRPGGTPDPQSTPSFDFQGGIIISSGPPEFSEGGQRGGSTSSGGSGPSFSPGVECRVAHALRVFPWAMPAVPLAWVAGR